MKMMGIYCVKNTVTNEIYIGSTRDLHHRKIAHFSSLRNNKHENHRLQKSYDKHGVESFLYTIVEYVDSLENLTNREQFWMDELKPQFNILSKADNHSINITEELKRKHKRHSEMMKGRPKSEEGRKNIAIGRRNYWLNPENRERHIAIIRKSAKKISDGTSKYLYTLISPEGEEVEVRSIKRFAEERGYSPNWMQLMAQGKRKSSSGWTLKERKFVGFKKDR